MSASRKTTSKPATSPAPATKTASAKTVAKIKPAPVQVQAITPSPVAMKAPAQATAPAAATPPAATPLALEPVLTSITAQVDVGFGNLLFIRGEGPGLSWEKGVAMECVESERWQIVLTESAPAYTFKFLVNDETWSTGPDFTAACGTSARLRPEF